MNQRQQQKEATRERIIAAAWHLFSERGFAAVRTLDIARAAGVSHGAVFAHFATREDLIILLMERFMERIIGEINRRARQSDGIRAVLLAHVQGLTEGEDFYTWLLRETHRLPPPARATLVGVQSAVAHHLDLVIRGPLRASAETRLPFSIFFNGWLGYLHHHLINADLFAPGRSLLANRGAELVDQYLLLTQANERN